MNFSIFSKRFFLPAAMLLMLSAPAFPITISPATQILETEPGVAKTFTVKVLNDSKDKATMECYMSDMEIDKKGNKIFKPVGTTGQSVAKYITIAEPSKFILGPQESREVVLTANIPKGVVGGNKAIAFFQAKPVEDKVQGKKLIMSVRAGTTILQETKGTVDIRSKIKSADIIPPASGNPLTVKVKVKNEGNTYLMSTGIVTILGPKDSFVGSVELDKALIFPGKEAELEGQLTTVDEVEPGTYHALITYQYRDKSISIDRVFTIK
jgi:hypothetical protein